MSTNRNAGQKVAWNHGVELVHTDFVAVIDSDDHLPKGLKFGLNCVRFGVRRSAQGSATGARRR